MSRLNEIYVEQTILSLFDIGAHYIFQMETQAAFMDLLLVYLGRHKAIPREDVDLVSDIKKTSVKTKLSDLRKDEYIKIRTVTYSGGSVKRMIRLIVLSDKGIDAVCSVMEKYMPGLMESKYKAVALYKMSQIGIKPEEMYRKEEVRDVIKKGGLCRGRITPRRIHDIYAATTYWRLLSNIESRYINKFSIESVYDIMGRLVDDGEKIRPRERVRACRSDIYYSFMPYTASVSEGQFMIEHDMCSEHILVIEDKIKQYLNAVYVPRITEHYPLPSLIFTITAVSKTRRGVRSDKELLCLNKSTINFVESLKVICSMINKGLFGSGASVDRSVLTIRFLRFTLSGYADKDNELIGFLDKCVEIFGAEAKVEDVINFVCNWTKEGMNSDVVPKNEDIIVSRKKGIYRAVLSNDIFCRTVFSKGGSVMCVTAADSADITTVRLDDRRFELFLIERMRAQYGTFQIRSYSEFFNVPIEQISKNGVSELALRNAFTCNVKGNEKLYCCENISSDIGAFWRLKALSVVRECKRPFSLILLYSPEEMDNLPAAYKKILLGLLEKAAGCVEILGCRFEHTGARVSYSTLSNGISEIKNILSGATGK